MEIPCGQISTEPGAIRLIRLATGVILSCLTGSFAVLLVLGIGCAEPMETLAGLPVVACCAFPAAGVQAVLYSLLMEYCVWRFVGRNVCAILVSSLLGLACGLTFGPGDLLELFLFAGFFAGLTTGFALYLLKKGRHSEQTPSQSSGAVV